MLSTKTSLSWGRNQGISIFLKQLISVCSYSWEPPVETNMWSILHLICSKSPLWDVIVKSILFAIGKCRCKPWHSCQIAGALGFTLIHLNLNIFMYKMGIIPIVTPSKKWDNVLKLWAQSLTHSKCSIKVHGYYYCFICYYYHCSYIKNFTDNFPLLHRMLLGTTCLYIIFSLFSFVLFYF